MAAEGPNQICPGLGDGESNTNQTPCSEHPQAASGSSEGRTSLSEDYVYIPRREYLILTGGGGGGMGSVNLTQTQPNIHQKLVQVLKEEYLYPIRRESLM